MNNLIIQTSSIVAYWHTGILAGDAFNISHAVTVDTFVQGADNSWLGGDNRGPI